MVSGNGFRKLASMSTSVMVGTFEGTPRGADFSYSVTPMMLFGSSRSVRKRKFDMGWYGMVSCSGHWEVPS
jgi:hypothetical protein